MAELNQVSRRSLAREPRTLVRLNDVDFAPQSWSVVTNTFYQANTAEVTFSLGHLKRDQQLDYFAKQRDIRVEIYAGFLPSHRDPNEYARADLDRIFFGDVDDITMDPVKQNVRLRCRDLTHLFIDNTTTEKYTEMTASEIAAKLAKDRGLKSRVVDTKVVSGVIYKDQHTVLETERSEWDLITYLAQSENYLAYIDEETLVFVPRGSTAGDPYRLHWEPPTVGEGQFSNMIRFEAKRSLSLSREVVVKVRSWNRQKKKGFTKTVTATNSQRTKSRGGTATTHVVRQGGLTEEEAIQLGRKKLKEITDHEIRIVAVLPGDSLIKPETVLQVTGTRSDLDQTYFVDNVLRKFDFRTGYTMEVRAKNSSTQEQVVG